MTLPTDRKWFTETCSEAGSAESWSIEAQLAHEITDYQTIDVYRTTQWGNLMAIDGFVMLTTRDNFLYHEMMAHPVLNAHAAPKRVAIVGGGDCGTLNEVLKHPEVESAIQIEIDERVTRLSEQYFPELCARNDDPRAELYFGDGLAWMRDVAPGSVDVVIVDSTDPVGPAEGLFGPKFYGDVFRALGKDGLLVHQSESPLLHQELIVAMHRAMHEAGFSQTHLLHFPQPVYPSGWWSASLACKRPMLEERLDERAIAALETQYYNAATHRAAFALPNYLREQLDAL